MSFKKKLAIGSIVLFFVSRAFSSSSKMGSVNSSNSLRDCDVHGCGYFGASRGNRSHNGLDFVTYENEQIKAPFDCKVTRYGYPYANDLNYRLIEVVGTGAFSDYRCKIMYIKKTLEVGVRVKKGGVLCLSDNIAKRFSPGMINHVHVEVYKNNVLIDPTSYFNV